MSRGAQRRAERWPWLAGVFLLAMAVRLFGLGELPLGYDESTTLRVLDMDWPELVNNRLNMTHSPFYFALLKVSGLTGAPFLWPRLPSALFDAGAATLFAVIGLRIAGTRGLLSFGFLYIAAPILMNWGQAARPNALLNLFSVWLLLAGLMFVTYPRLLGGALIRPDLPWWLRRVRIIAFVSVFAASVGALYTMLAGLLVTVAIDVPVTATLIAVRQWGALSHWLLLRAFAVTAWVPLAVALYRGVAARAGNYWVPPPNLDRWLEFLGRVLFMWKDSLASVAGERELRIVLALSLSAIAIIGSVTLVRRKKIAPLALFIGAALIPILLITIASMHTPLLVDRYAMFSTIGFLAIAATGLASAWHGRARLAAACFVSIIALNLAQYIWLDRRYDFRTAAEIIRLRDGPGANLYGRGRPATGVTLYFLQRPRPSRFPKLEDLVPELGSIKAAWLLDLRDGRELRRVLAEAKEVGLRKKMLRVETFRFKGYQLHRIQMVR